MPTSPAGRGPFALVIYAAVGALAGIVGLTASAGVVDSMPLAAAVGLAAAGAAVMWLRRRLDAARLFPDVPAWARRRFLVGASLVLIQLVPLTAFIIDPNVSTWAAGPLRPWQSRHSCVSCYWVAADKATTGADLWDETVYRPRATPETRRPNLGPFFVDVFEYPPTFLPLPRLLAWLTPDFWGFRRLWFALNLAGVVGGLVLIGRRLDTALGTSAVWLTPWVLVAPTVIGTLQAGNVQLLFLVQSAVAMLLFERKRHALGGALLGYAIASKLYPGVLVFFLLFRRDWRAVGWTAAAGAAITLVTLADVGWTPFAGFFAHLPKIVSGEAFPGLRSPSPISINESIPGLVFKLQLLGVPGMGFQMARLVGWIYTAILAAAVAGFAWRTTDRRYAPLVWIAILILATLRSPFLPGYGVFPSLWLATLLAALAWSVRPLRLAVSLAWLLLALSLGQGYVQPLINAAWTFGHTVVALVLVFVLLPRVSRGRAPVHTPAVTEAVPA